MIQPHRGGRETTADPLPHRGRSRAIRRRVEIVSCAQNVFGNGVVLATVWGPGCRWKATSRIRQKHRSTLRVQTNHAALMEINPEASRSAGSTPATCHSMALDDEAPPIGHAALDHQGTCSYILHDSVNDDGMLGDTHDRRLRALEALDPVRAVCGVCSTDRPVPPVMLENWSPSFRTIRRPCGGPASSDPTQHLMLVSQYQEPVISTSNDWPAAWSRRSGRPDRHPPFEHRRSGSDAARDPRDVQAGQHGLVVRSTAPRRSTASTPRTPSSARSTNAAIRSCSASSGRPSGRA